VTRLGSSDCKLRASLAGEAQGVRKHADGVGIRRPVDAACEVADDPCADAGSLGESLPRERGGQPVLPQKLPEGWGGADTRVPDGCQR